MLKRGLLLAGLLALGACSQAPVSSAETTDLQAQKISTSGDDGIDDVAVHKGSGAVYALSYTQQGSEIDVFLRRFSRGGTVVWQRQLGANPVDLPHALATDPSGNVYVSYNDEVEKRRGDGSLVWSLRVPTVTTVATDKNGNVYVGSNDYGDNVILSKYTAAGSLVWTRSRRGDVDISPTGIAADASGNVYVAALDASDGYLASFLLKYSPSGQKLIDKAIVAATGAVSLRDVAVQGSALYLGGRRFVNNDVGVNQLDGFVVKLSLDGTEQWRRAFGTPKPDSVNGLAADANGGLYLTGFTGGSLDGASSGGNDIFFRKYSSSGQALWTKQIGSAGNDFGNAVAVYSSRELYLGGEAGGALLGGTYRGGQDGFLRRTDGNGNRVWTDQ